MSDEPEWSQEEIEDEILDLNASLLRVVTEKKAMQKDLTEYRARIAVLEGALAKISGMGGVCTSDDLDKHADDCPICIAESALEPKSATGEKV